MAILDWIQAPPGGGIDPKTSLLIKAVEVGYLQSVHLPCYSDELTGGHTGSCFRLFVCLRKKYIKNRATFDHDNPSPCTWEQNIGHMLVLIFKIAPLFLEFSAEKLPLFPEIFISEKHPFFPKNIHRQIINHFFIQNTNTNDNIHGTFLGPYLNAYWFWKKTLIWLSLFGNMEAFITFTFSYQNCWFPKTGS